MNPLILLPGNFQSFRLRKITTILSIVLSGSMGTATVSAAEALNDAEILGIYIQVNSFDIETALLGRAQGHTAGVRALGTHVSHDHIGVRQAAFDLAKQCGVVPGLPTERQAAAEEHGKAINRLRQLKGTHFDAAYLKHEEAFHVAAIDAVRSGLMPAARCVALKEHFDAVLPAFKQHLEMTRKLLK